MAHRDVSRDSSLKCSSRPDPEIFSRPKSRRFPTIPSHTLRSREMRHQRMRVGLRHLCRIGTQVKCKNSKDICGLYSKAINIVLQITKLWSTGTQMILSCEYLLTLCLIGFSVCNNYMLYMRCKPCKCYVCHSPTCTPDKMYKGSCA